MGLTLTFNQVVPGSNPGVLTNPFNFLFLPFIFGFQLCLLMLLQFAHGISRHG